MADGLAPRVAIVGAGYAGLACAVELADAGLPVTVFEASRTLGGRARTIEIDGRRLDNGMHLLIGAYRETLRLLAKVGAGETAPARPALSRRALRLEFPGQFSLSAPRWPAPLHLAWALLTARGLSPREKQAAMRFMRQQQSRCFQLPEDLPTSVLLAGQPERVRRFLWEPLCLAALNTPVDQASARIFLNVLRDSLCATRAASDLLLPTTDLSSLFPEPAARFIAARGGEIRRGTRIRALSELATFDHVVLAVAPCHLAALAPEMAAGYRFDWQPIATVYLAYPASTRLPFPLLGLTGGHGQWVFDRGALHGQAGLLAVVISGTGPWQGLDHSALARAMHGEIQAILPGLPAPAWSRVIEEKRATFASTPGLRRPPTGTRLPNVWLAGDYVAGDYPATLEGAIASGVAAARSILGQAPRHQP